MLTADFEKGTAAATVATADTGSASAWNAINLGTNAVLIYDATHAQGTQACKLASGATAVSPRMEWNTAFGTHSGTHYGRFYIYPTGNTTYVGANYRTGTTIAAQILVTPAAKLELWTGVALVKTSTIAIPLNAWSRVEWYVVQSATVGQMGYRIYTTNANGQVPDETFDSTANKNTRVSCDSVQFGVPAGNFAANIVADWLDMLVADASDWPGPANNPIKTQPTNFQTPGLM